MKLVFHTFSFPPTLGGIQTFLPLLVRHLEECGASVTVIVEQPEPPLEVGGRILHRPKLVTTLKEISECDVYVQHGVLGLRQALLLFSGCKGCVVHHWQYRWNLLFSAATRLGCRHIAVSDFIARTIPAPSTVIHNLFRAEAFHFEHLPRSHDVLFCGRICWTKGISTLLGAIKELRARGEHIRLTIAGEGPARSELEALARFWDLADLVNWIGRLEDDALGYAYATHRIVAIPSNWGEPFGIVALEALASGCKIVSTTDGALPEVLGDFAIFVPPNSPEALADAISEVLHQPNDSLSPAEFEARTSYLAKFHPSAVAERYFATFSEQLLPAKSAKFHKRSILKSKKVTRTQEYIAC